MLIIVLLSLFSLSGMAQDYTLFQAENEHYRAYTREELMTRLGEDSALLKDYGCNGVDEWDLFKTAPRHNPASMSLKVGSLFYREGSFFHSDGTVAHDDSHEFVSSVAQALKLIEALPEGANLLRELERSHFPVTIAKGGNSFNPKDDTGRNYFGIYQANAIAIFHQGRMSSEAIPFASIGAGGTVNWNPKTEGLLPHIALAHELFHALDSVRGLLDMRFVRGKNYEQAFVSEYRAVYFENLYRRASNLPYRTHYGQDQVGPGVLDEEGEPRKMPAPCLN